MALTAEEKLTRLHNMEDWKIYSPEQKVFLENIAGGSSPDVAMHKARPELPLTGVASVRFHAGRLMKYPTIKRAFDAMDYVKPEPVYSKREALEDITYRLRKQSLDDDAYIKLLSILAKMNGWDKPKLDKPEKPPEEDFNQVVVDLERKRRNGEEN